MTSIRKLEEIRLLSLVEALTVTGPVKPLLTFSALMRAGFGNVTGFAHAVATTRRPKSTADSRDDLLAAVMLAGATYVVLPERRAFDFAVVQKLSDAIHAFQPDIVETHDCKSHLLFRLARILDKRLRRLPWVAYHHGYTRTSWRVLAYQQLDRLTLRKADRVVTVCRRFAEMLTSRRGVPREKISVITNTLNSRPAPSRDAITQARIALQLPADEYVILSVGRLSSEKGHRDLLAALGLILRDGLPKIRLLIVGEGPEKRELKHLAATFGSNVILTGHVSDPWVLYHLAQLFVLPSHSEGVPLVILEAMAAGLPIVSTTVGGIPDLLRHRRSALLVPPHSPPDLACAITELLQDTSLRVRLTAEATAALAQCSPDAYTKRLLSIYRQVTANRSL